MDDDFKNINFYEKAKHIPANAEHREALQQECDDKRKAYIATLPPESQENYNLIEGDIIRKLTDRKIPYVLMAWPEHDKKDQSPIMYQAFTYDHQYSDNYFKAVGKYVPQMLHAVATIVTLLLKMRIVLIDMSDENIESIEGYYYKAKYYEMKKWKDSLDESGDI